MNKNVKGWLAVAVIFVVLPAVALSLLWKDRCQVKVVNTGVSPDGAWQVTIVHKDCGPAMDIATEAQLSPADDVDDQDQIMLLHGPHAVAIAWTQEGLELTPPRDATVVARAQQSGPFKVIVRTQ